MYKKYFTFIIIILLTSISFNQLITANVIDDDNNEQLYELKTNFLNEKNTIYVTKETLNEISIIINETSEKFSQYNDYSKGLPIIIDAMRDLHNIGLFQNKSIDEIESRFNEQIMELEFQDNNIMNSNINDLDNYSLRYFCYVTGEVEIASFNSLIPILAYYIFYLEMYKFFYPLLHYIFLPLSLIYYILLVAEMVIFNTEFLSIIPFVLWAFQSEKIPIHFFNFLDFGFTSSWNHGCVSTLGLTGTKLIEGTFVGGMSGFTGLGLFSPDDSWFLGFAKKSYIVYK